MNKRKYVSAGSVKLAKAVLLLVVAIACGREGDRPAGNSPASVEASSASNPVELRNLPADQFRTDVPVSHYYGNREVSLYGEYCDHSGNELRSRRYGAVAMKADGTVFRFRSVENLVWYMQEKELGIEDFQAIGIVDFISANRLMKPDELMFHLSRNLPSPGGSWVSAMNPAADPSLLYNIMEAYPGTRHSWEEVFAFLSEKREGN
jgi:hypothetical protein